MKISTEILNVDFLQRPLCPAVTVHNDRNADCLYNCNGIILVGFYTIIYITSIFISLIAIFMQTSTAFCCCTQSYFVLQEL